MDLWTATLRVRGLDGPAAGRGDKQRQQCELKLCKGKEEYLEKFLGLPHENTVAVGDQENDIPMIQNAAIGVAMKNSDKKAKEAADYITEHDNNHDGVAEVIRRFILNE